MFNIRFMRGMLLASIFVVMLGTGTSYASAFQSPLTSFLLSYNISATTIASSGFTNITSNGNTYVLMQISPGKEMVINSTHGYSIMTNATLIAKVMNPYLSEKYYPNSSALNALNATFYKYKDAAAPPLTDCLVETGLNHYTFSIQNNGYSCQTVPVCYSVLGQLGGPSSVFGQAIMNFSTEYAFLNGSYNDFMNAYSTLNTSDFKSNLNIMSSAISNMSTAASQLPLNNLFPPPGTALSQLSNCAQYVPGQGPSYCNYIGYCEYTSFNSSILGTLSTQVDSLKTLPVSTASQVNQYDINASNTAIAYVEPVIIARNTTEFNAMLAAFYPKYNYTVVNSTRLLSRYDNSSLNRSLSIMESEFSLVKSKGINQNITRASDTLNGALQNLSTTYASVSPKYLLIYNKALNDTMQLLYRQLNFRQVPVGLALLSAQQEHINNMFSGRISSNDLTPISVMLSNVSSKVGSFGSPLSLPAFVKSLDGGFVNSMLFGSGGSIQSKIASAPLYTALVSFIIGIAILLVVYGTTYARLKRKKRIKMHAKVKKAWMMLFAGIFVLVLIYTFATYAIAASANAFLPISGFMSAANSGNVIAIAVNQSGGANSSIVGCASALQATMSGVGKKVSIVSLDNYSCTIANSTVSIDGPACYNRILGSNEPMVLLSPGSNSSIIYKGMYGTVLYANGQGASGASCYLNKIFQQELK